MEKLGQLFVIGLSGPDLKPEEKKFIVDNNIGGVILFGRNCESPKQIYQLCQEIQSLSQKQKDQAPLFISIDQEGGRVARLQPPYTQWPSAAQVTATDSGSKAFEVSNAMGAELRATGINIDYAPCVDVLTNPKNTLIGDRSYGSDAETVAKMSSAIVRGFIKADVMPCAKHFPGHGNTIIDSHEDLPIENLSLDELREHHLPPFQRVIKSRIDLIMTAHMKFPQIDEEWPVTLSEVFLQKILREELRYRGLIMTDNLEMKALTNYYEPNFIALRSLQAGADLLLYGSDNDDDKNAYEYLQKSLNDKTLDANLVDIAHERILKVKEQRLKNIPSMTWEEAEKVIGCNEHRELSESLS